MHAHLLLWSSLLCSLCHQQAVDHILSVRCHMEPSLSAVLICESSLVETLERSTMTDSGAWSTTSALTGATSEQESKRELRPAVYAALCVMGTHLAPTIKLSILLFISCWTLCVGLAQGRTIVVPQHAFTTRASFVRTYVFRATRARQRQRDDTGSLVCLLACSTD